LRAGGSDILPRLGAVSTVSIPNRPAFRAQEVCEIVGVQSYVLKGWEAEFPDLGVSKTPTGPRVYRRSDVERVLQLKHLIAVEGLTLAGARRRLAEEAAAGTGIEAADGEADDFALLDDESRAHLQEVRQGLRWILKTLDSRDAAGFALAADPQPARKVGKASRAKKK
jgi:DNA-binding transcriptional MerR regulator